jgi:hypothetical protein
MTNRQLAGLCGLAFAGMILGLLLTLYGLGLWFNLYQDWSATRAEQARVEVAMNPTASLVEIRVVDSVEIDRLLAGNKSTPMYRHLVPSPPSTAWVSTALQSDQWYRTILTLSVLALNLLFLSLPITGTELMIKSVIFLRRRVQSAHPQLP